MVAAAKRGKKARLLPRLLLPLLVVIVAIGLMAAVVLVTPALMATVAPWIPGLDSTVTGPGSGDAPDAPDGSGATGTTAGTPGSTPETGDSPADQIGALEVGLTAGRSSLAPGESTPLVLTVRNSGPSSLQVSFKTSLEVDFTVENTNGVIWQWSRGVAVDFEPTDLVLRPGQTASYTAAWDGRDDAGRPLPAGEYTVRGIFLGQTAGRTLPIVAAPVTVVVES